MLWSRNVTKIQNKIEPERRLVTTMNADSSLSVERYVQLPLFTGIDLPAYPEPVFEPELDPTGDVSRHPEFSEFPSLFNRFLKVLISALPLVFSGIWFDEKKYRFDFLNRRASVHFVPLDNPPADQGAKTSLSEAKAALDKLWGDGFCPLDYFSFRQIVDDTLRDTSFTDILERRYARYHTVHILFADPIQLGESPENHYLVYELRYGLEYTHLTVMHESKLFSLFAGETVIAACVPRDDVIMRPEFECKKSKAVARLPEGWRRGFCDPKAEAVTETTSDWLQVYKENRQKRNGLPVSTKV